MRLRLPVAAVCALTAGLLAGCGADAPATPTRAHAAFLARVGEACQPAVDVHRGHAFPLTDFDPLHPDPRELPTVGDYFASYGGLPATDRAMHALQPPAVDADAWHDLMRLVDQITANAQQQVRAARASDVTAFVETVRTSESLTNRLNVVGDRFGLRSDSACAEVFG
ncbi:MAG TPA: hypothetical protein VFE07_13390 [Marmoricola sp.]|jgi:hypothetical protein|nr:hypothetical protein [Marmoricola sp.]